MDLQRLIHFSIFLTIITAGFARKMKPISQLISDTEVSDSLDLDAYRQAAGKWLSVINVDLEDMSHHHALLLWQLNTNMTPEAKEEMSRFESHRLASSARLCREKKEWDVRLLSHSQKRMMGRLCHGIRWTQKQSKEWVETTSKLSSIYSGAVVNVAGRNYSGESEINRLMTDSRNYSVLLDAWTGWRDTVGPPSKEPFQRMIELGNTGARAGGYRDMSETWKNELEIDNLEEVVDKLYDEVEPLYKQLYAYVRGRLAASDQSGTVKADKPLPAHVLGNMWAQNWESLMPILLPEGSVNREDATSILHKRYSSFVELAELAQDFFVSLGFPRLPRSFWERSQFVQPTDGRKAICHGSASNFFRNQDVRILMCGKVSEEDLYILYHEMGHLYYYLSYDKQPQLFRVGANSAFHEAIGDTIIYAAMATPHRQRLGFTGPRHNLKKMEIENLLRQALVKIPLLPFSLALEKWRWNVMADRVKPSEYNRAWWDLKLRYQGIVPPIKRSDKKDFDPGAKFHIISNTPYIRYFLSGILQVQFFQALCDVSGQGPQHGQPLNQCDIYGSTAAGDRFKAMMSLGGSKPWNVALNVLTNGKSHELSAKPLMDYYRPLLQWLKAENLRFNYTI